MSLVPCFVEVYHIWTLTEQEVQYTNFYFDSNDGILFEI